MKKRFLVIPFLVLIPLGFMILLAYFMDKQYNFEPGGETTYMNYCSGCHGKTGNGMGITARVKRLKPPNFRSPEFWNTKSDEELLDVVKNGKDKMPQFEKFIREPDRNAVLAYIKKKFKPEETTPSLYQKSISPDSQR